MSSLKEFAAARKLDPCPSTNSPGSVSQLSRSTVETPAMERSVHTNTKPLEDHTLSPPIDSKENQDSVFTLEQNLHCKPSFQRTDTNQSTAQPSLAAQGNSVTERGLGPNAHCRTPVQRTSTKPFAEQPSLANSQGNQLAGFMPSSHLIPSGVPEAFTSKSVSFSVERAASKLIKFKRESVDQDKSERKVFNGMTLVLDFKPVNGSNVARMKCNEMKVDERVVNQSSSGEVSKNPENEKLSNEQSSSSPLLFATPQSSPSPSPVKLELNSFKPVQGEERAGLNTPNLNLFCHTSSEVKTVGSGDSNRSKSSISASKKGESGSQVIVETTFEEKEESKPRDILDDLKENFPQEKAGLANCWQTTLPKIERDADLKESTKKDLVNLSSKRGAHTSSSASEVPINVRQGQRKSTRRRRSLNSTVSTKKEEKEASEV